MKKNILVCTLLAGTVALMLTACSSDPKPELPCPTAGLLQDADAVSFKKDTTATLSPANVAVKARFGSYRGGCKVARGGGIDYTLELDIMISKADAEAPPATQNLPYFIAVLTPDERVISRTTFETTAEFNNWGQARLRDSQDVHVPENDPAAAAKYKIVAGFVLSPEQAEYNRAKRAGLPAPVTGQ